MPRESNESVRPKRVTLQDIADAAGVHIMTVSNALGDKRSVAAETREKVQRIARELNYIPNPVARSLVGGRTGNICVFSGNINEPYYANMVHMLKELMSADGYRVTLVDKPAEVIDLVNATGSIPVDGVIAIDLYSSFGEFRSHPAAPCVSIGTYKRSFLDYVIVDLSAGVEEALDIMWEQGRRRIAYFVNTWYLAQPDEVRARTYLDFMQSCGQAPEIINADTNLFPLVRQRLHDYLQTHQCPEALLCLNDELAMCAFRVLRDLGYRVPEDVLLVGCDGQPHMEYFDPPLSTIAQPVNEMCAIAWKFLQRRMAEPELPLQSAILQGKLEVRKSLRP
jgi:DNA-binding LacI/PurR family transcriptional regulator